MLRLMSVFYSSRSEHWKIGDFGLTAEGTSKRAQTTFYSRGTAGYRAPELVRELGTYSSKVDIWAIGCIFFELIFLTPAFSNDFYVGEYYRRCQSSKEQVEMSLDSLAEVFPDSDSRNSAVYSIHAMFEIDPLRRPSTQDIRKRLSGIFNVDIAYELTDLSIGDIVNRLNDTTLPQSAVESAQVNPLGIVVIDKD
jgi:serine/threonine protein kinase